MCIVTFVAVVLIAVKSYLFNTGLSKNVDALKSGIAITAITQSLFLFFSFSLFFFFFFFTFHVNNYFGYICPFVFNLAFSDFYTY